MMKIAIVGKGGSGKTTISSLFSLYVDTQGMRVGLLDVDVNSHTAEVLGGPCDESKNLSNEAARQAIKTFLAGKNKRVQPREFLNTTPPGGGSNRWTLDDTNFITKQYGVAFGKQSHVFTLGSYSGKSIGADCHHSTQHIAENILTHAKLAAHDIIVVDSVAGNDTFANSLYLQDILLFVLKPEREGLSVFERYYDLAKKAGVADRVYVLANQVTSKLEQAFIKKNVPSGRLVAMVSSDQAIIAKRLEGEAFTAADVSDELAKAFNSILAKLAWQARTPQDYYQEIVRLHTCVAAQGWVAGAYRTGLVDQIDPDYTAD